MSLDDAVDAPSIYVQIDKLLRNVPVIDKDLTNVVKKYAENALNWHVVVRLAMNVLSSNENTVRLGRILNSLESCTSKDTPAPPFLVDFQQQFVQDWALAIVSRLVSKGGQRWGISERAHLASQLRAMCSKGLCHRQHVSLVDAGKNPSWLGEYIRCILCIWKDNDGGVTPEKIQYFKKLASCTSECVSIICQYAAVCLKADEVDQLAYALFRMQRVVFSSFGKGCISNSAASQCVRAISFDVKVFGWLSKTEAVLSNVWELITTPQFQDGQCILLPGIPGSHVEEFSIPRVAVLKGSPELITNCIRSSLMLSFLNPDQDHAIEILSSSNCVTRLRLGLKACVESMLRVDRFGGETGCTVEWWEDYIKLTVKVLEDLCQSFGFDKTGASERGAVSYDVSYLPEQASTAVPAFQLKRLAYKDSNINKVNVAGNLFDVTASIVLRGCSGSRVRLQSVCNIKNATTGDYKRHRSVGGKVFADMRRITTDLDLTMGVVVDLENQNITYKTTSYAMRMLQVLLDYMEEFSKSRRKRGGNIMLKRNAKPEQDGRKKPKRPSTPASTVCGDNE